MKGKVLFVATVLRGHILVFHLPYMRWFQEQGYEVHVCARNDTEESAPQVPFCHRYLDMPFERSPLHPGNLKVYHELKRLMEQENYALIHCHTPVGGMMGRLCARKSRKQGSRVLYTVHGFHFFRGAPLSHWLLFYPAERFLARYTDLLITINGEDAARARKFPAKRVELLKGVGIDLGRFETAVDRAAVRESIGVPKDVPVVICVGEHIPRKNHETVLRAVAKREGVWLLFCGVGELTEPLTALCQELGISQRVRFLGFRKDVPELLKASDAFVFPSFQEGLPVSLMEAMAAGLPCAVSRVRGNADLIGQGQGGFLREPKDVEGFAEDLGKMLESESLRAEMGARNRREIVAYGLPTVLAQMAEWYRFELSQGEEPSWP